MADVSLRGLLGYRRVFGEVTPTATQAFAGGASFDIAGAPLARNAAVLKARRRPVCLVMLSG
jgi:uncharacterized protein with beta-barrel porin domain